MPDDELIAAYEAGDESAFAKLVEQHLPGVYNFAARLVGKKEDAEDIAQETFLKAWKNLSRFKKGANFKTWLFSIARNTAIDHLRKKRPLLFGEFSDEEDTPYEGGIPDTAPTSEALFDQALRKETVEAAVESLPPHYREIIILHYQEHMTLEEAAQTLGIPLNTAKSRDRRALIELKKRLEPETL